MSLERSGQPDDVLSRWSRFDFVLRAASDSSGTRRPASAVRGRGTPRVFTAVLEAIGESSRSS